MLMMILASCVKKESSFDELQNKKIPVDSFFEKVIAQNPKTKDEDNAFYIDYNWNRQTKTVEITNVIEKELDFFPFTSFAERKELLLSKNKYKVTCVVNGKDEWSKICDGMFSCGSLIMDCLDSEGCETVCTNKMIFIPQDKEFYLIDLGTLLLRLEQSKTLKQLTLKQLKQ